MRNAIFYKLLALLCLPISICAAQSPSSSSAAGDAVLLFQSDADCSVSIDGGDPVSLAKDALLRVSVTPGEHILQAASNGPDPAKWQQVVTATAGQQKAVIISMQSIIAKQHDMTDAHGRAPGQEGYQCVDNKPGDCMFDRYLVAFVSLMESEDHSQTKVSSPDKHVRQNAMSEASKKVLALAHQNQAGREDAFSFLTLVVQAMDSELDIREKSFRGKRTLFTSDNIADTFAQTLPNRNILLHVEDALAKYIAELRASDSGNAHVDLDDLFRKALFDNYKESAEHNGLSTTDDDLRHSVDFSLTKYHFFGVLPK